MVSQRELLRDATQGDHDRLDRAMWSLDLQSVEGYRRFLDVHHRAIGAWEVGLRNVDLKAANHLSASLKGISKDLDALGACSPEPWRPDFRLRPFALGASYVFHGARLGARVILVEVRKSSDNRVANATSFLEGQAELAPWRQTLADLEAYKDDMNPVVAAAKSVFATFWTALDEISETDRHAQKLAATATMSSDECTSDGDI